MSRYIQTQFNQAQFIMNSISKKDFGIGKRTTDARAGLSNPNKDADYSDGTVSETDDADANTAQVYKNANKTDFKPNNVTQSEQKNGSQGENPILSLFSSDNLLNGILMSEILGRPKSRRGR